MFDQPIRPEGSEVSDPKKKESARAAYKAKKAEKKALAIASGKREPHAGPAEGSVHNPKGRPKSIVNRVTEYGALFNQLNEQRTSAGLPPLKTAMETLIEALQSDELDIKDRARIAEKIAAYESSRAPVISIEHVQNVVNSEDTVDAEDALDDFMESLRKV
jgi:hypothetical protein